MKRKNGNTFINKKKHFLQVPLSSPWGSSVRRIFPDKNTGVSYHFFLQGTFPTRIEPALQADRFFTSAPLWTSHKDLHFCIYPLGGSSSPYRRKETRWKVRAICALQCVSHFSWPGRKTCFLLGLNSHKESSLTWIRFKLNHLSNLEPLSQKVKTTVSQLLRWVSTSFMDLPFVVSLQQQQQQIPYLLNFLTSYSFSAVYHY